MSIASRNRQSNSAESRRCPKCRRKSAIKREVVPGQVIAYCRWDDCDYESATDTTDWSGE